MNAKVSLACWSLILGVLLSSSGAWAAEPGSQLSGTLDGTSGHVPFGPYGPQGYGPGAYGPEAYGQGAYGPGTFGPGMAPPGGPGMGAVSFADAVAGQEPGNNIGYPVAVPFGPQVAIEGNFSDGLGWLGNYYGARAMIPKHLDPGRSLLFTTIKLSGSDEGGGIINFGQGYRYYSQSQNRIYTLAGFADLDDGHEETYFRLSLHASTQGKFLDINANTYMVLNNFLPGLDGRNVIEDQYYGPLAYQQNLVMSNRRQVTETAYGGGEIEAGGRLPFIGRYGISGYAGGYFLTPEEGDSAAGVKLRFEANVTQDITVGMQYSNDGVFDHNTWMNVSWSFPPGPKHRTFKPKPVRELLAGPVARLDRIQVLTEVEETIEPLTYADGSLITVYHVNGNGLSNGNGTSENPSNTLVGTGGQSIILVSGFQVNSAGTAVLQDNQRLLGTGLTQTAFSRERGTFILPGTGTGINPTLFNTNNGNVIQLANNNEVSGFTINGSGSLTGTPGGIGIIGNNITGFNINNSTITNSTDGVSLTNAVGTGIVNLVNFTDNTGVTPNPGVGFRHTVDNGGTSNLTFTNNTATGNGTGALVTASNGSTINVTASNNTFDDNTDPNTGAAFVADGGTVNINSFTNSSVQNNLGNGLRFEALDGGTLTISNFTGNQIEGNLSNGVHMVADGTGSTLTSTLGAIGGTTNSFSDNTGAGVNLVATDGADVTMNVYNNVFGFDTDGTNPAEVNGAGGLVASIEGSTFDLEVGNATLGSGNSFFGNTGAGLDVSSYTTAEVDVLIQRNSFLSHVDDTTTTGPNNPTGDGVYLSRNGGSTFTALVGNGTGQTGLGNLFENNAGSGLQVYAAGASPVGPGFTPDTNITFDGNIFRTNTRGAQLTTAGDAVAIFNNSDNLFDTNTLYGLEVTARDQSAIGDAINGTQSVFQGDTFIDNGVGNGGAAIRLLGAGDSGLGSGNALIGKGFMDVLIGPGTTITGGDNGILITQFAWPQGSPSIITIHGTTIRDVAVDGINAELAAGGSGGILNIGGTGTGEQVLISNGGTGTGDGAGDDGIDIVSSFNTNTVNVAGTTVQGFGDNGIEVIDFGGDAFLSDFQFNIWASSSRFNDGRGLSLFSSDSSSGLNDSEFNVGRAGAGNGVILSSNGQQGLSFMTYSDVTDGAVPSGIPRISQITTGLQNPTPGIYRDVNSPDFVDASLTVVNSFIQFNGADGMLLNPGSNTLMRVDVHDVTFGGNAMHDLFIAPIASQNPTNSVNSSTANADILVRDPVAHLELVFGVINSNPLVDDIPDTLAGNTGNSIGGVTNATNSVNDTYTDVLAGNDDVGGLTNVDGLFTNSDPFKTFRGVRGVYNFYTSGLLDGAPGSGANVFINNLGVQQNIENFFNNIGTVQGAGTPFPYGP
ncbi:MAG: hypothetical protein KDA79_07890 [Planctomycetaceae bacterium]|nr:hypothetical protein [Planctomycetaceae bacterium]